MAVQDRIQQFRNRAAQGSTVQTSADDPGIAPGVTVTSIPKPTAPRAARPPGEPDRAPAPPLQVTPESEEAARSRITELAAGAGGLPTTPTAGGVAATAEAEAGIPGVTDVGGIRGADVAAPGEAADPFATAEQKIQDIFAGREGDVSEITEAIRGMGDLRTSAFDQLFGEDSRISRFFAPSIQAVEEQILDTEGLLTDLRGDIVSRTKDVGLTQAQFRRVEAKERGALVDQMDKLVRSHTRLRAGLDIQLGLSDKEFDTMVQSGQDNIDALIFGFEQSGQLDEQEIDLARRALEFNLQETVTETAENRQIASEFRAEGRDINAEIRAEQAQIRGETREDKAVKEEGLQTLLSDMQNFIIEAGVVPTGNFQEVMDKAMADFAAGKTLAEIQLDLIRAVGNNPQVRDFITGGISAIGGGGGAGGGGGGGGGEETATTSLEDDIISSSKSDPTLFPPIGLIAEQTGQI
ncbi:hypothetical protein LCGC14_0568120 [marine sediment metagenome]|uniref:Uncharacterized protein n=1 Tax=marine sediment metagenome TaxID=412755 RepID=A0A0F9RJX1_9ZZZZ|nr:hypothetical protein [bacterium]